METGCRVPLKYIVVKGVGQTSEGDSADHWETGAYDLALLDAGIENFNVMTYTSVLPLMSEEITFDEGQRLFKHGAVLETIKAQMDGQQGEALCAGVGRMWVKCDGLPIGGYAAEFEGNCTEAVARKELEKALQGIFDRRYGDQPGYAISEMKFDTTSLVVDELFGTCFVAICFLTYELPELPEDEE